MNGGPHQTGHGGQSPTLRLVGGQAVTAQHAFAPTPAKAALPAEPARTLRVPGPAIARRDKQSPRPAQAATPRGPVAARVSKPMEATDPRWVLALRTSQCLEGGILAPERRQKLIRMGRVFGLTAFDANLIIAIVQDQARRGYRPEVCPRMGEAQLQMVPLPTRARILTLGQSRARRWTTIAMLIAAMAAVELAVLLWIFG